MKKVLFTGALAILALSTKVHPVDITGLYGDWCLVAMSAKKDGELISDNANYQFTKDGMLHYSMGFFQQSGKYTIDGERIRTKDMGNYKIISIDTDDMVLYYGAYMMFTKGKCK